MPGPRQTKVKVYLRSRPCENFADDMIEYSPDGKTVNIYNRKKSNNQAYVNNQITDWSFKVDGILHNVSQDTVYDDVVKDITLNVLDGYNGTVMCYGQTGAGKTFSMTGATENYSQRGIIPRTIQHLFKEIHNSQDRSFTVRIGYIEIYNEQLYDLLSTAPLANASEFNSGFSIYDDRGDVFVKGLTYQLCSNEEEALNLLFEGETNRSIGAHVLNKESSRSHCIFTIRVESKSISSSSDKYTLSKLNLVDLAGSERLAKTQSQGITQKEAQYINKSLSFLEQAVIGLSDSRKPFVQFRQSKLTHLLKDSIGGNCMTRMIANVWPESRHMEETVSTLRFASRMMNVTVEPAVNEIIDPMRMMQKLDNEVKMLRQELAMHDTLANQKGHQHEPLSEHQLFEIENQCRRYIEGSLDDIEIVNVRQIKATFNAFKRICKIMEKDVESRLREKYALIDRNDIDQMTEAQKAGYTLADDSSLAGETDGQGFGLGYASKDSRASKNDLLKITKKNRLKQTNKSSSPVPEQQKPSLKTGVSKDSDPLKKDLKEASTSGSLGQNSKDFPRLSTPPSKNIAFEEFKAERGNEINRIWNENKDILSSKRRQYSDLAHKINETKTHIDHTRAEVDRKRNERLSLGEFVNEMGETIIDEEEFSLIKKLQDLKSRYRDDFDRWRELKAEIVYCQNLVEQCRQRLIQEFDAWYNEIYLSSGLYATKDDGNYGSAVFRQYEDAVEKFERMQTENMATELESLPYNTARNRTDKRRMYNDAMERSSHHYVSSAGYPSSGTPHTYQLGTPMRKIANPPPGKLTVS